MERTDNSYRALCTIRRFLADKPRFARCHPFITGLLGFVPIEEYETRMSPEDFGKHFDLLLSQLEAIPITQISSPETPVSKGENHE
jgi:hypothetical protein